jgi:formylglycine-generating enzyme required for sulfatase activity
MAGVFLLVTLWVAPLLYAAEVGHTVVEQENSRIVFRFDVAGPEVETTVRLVITVKGKNYDSESLHVEGDVGRIKTGKGKKIYWDLLKDFPDDPQGKFDYTIEAESATAPVPKRSDAPIKAPSKNTLQLGDIETRAKEIEASKAVWAKNFNEMKLQYNRVQEVEKKDIPSDMKIDAWRKFEAAFTEKNPYTDEDDILRAEAKGRIEYWQAEKVRTEEAKVVEKRRQAEEAAAKKEAAKTGSSSGSTYTDPTTGMEFVFVKGGCYQMGDTFGDGYEFEKPVHEVCVGDFYIGKYEVTQGQWRKVMGSNPSHFTGCGDNCPVEHVSWDDSQNFLGKLSEKGGKGYRLPSEAEWEYAARSGGKAEKYSGGNDLDSVAWYGSNSGSQTHPVGQKRPNGLGINDMSGNVWEWTGDWYGENYYGSSPRDNPRGASNGQYRALRGGSWYDAPQYARASYRIRGAPSGRGVNNGLRAVFAPR